MGRSWSLGSAFGIQLYLHWTFLLLPLWVLLLYRDADAGMQVFYVAVVVTLFACVLLHELGHALTARYFGIRTRDITLYPIGGVARLERMSEKPWEEFWIAVGGPAVNVVIAGILMAVLVGLVALAPDQVALGDASRPSLGNFLAHLLVGNIVLVVFNMLPAFPMDGGRVLRALLSLWLGQLQATRIAAGLGLVAALLLAVVGALWWHPFMLAVGFFVWIAGQQELQMLEWRHRQRQLEDTLQPLWRTVEVEVQPRPAPRPTAVYVWDERTSTWVPQPTRHAPFTWI